MSYLTKITDISRLDNKYTIIETGMNEKLNAQ